VKGSAKALGALLQGMIELEQYAVAFLIARKSSIPRFVALLPQPEEIDPDTNEMKQAAGFHVIFLPYADDVRNLEFEPSRVG